MTEPRFYLPLRQALGGLFSLPTALHSSGAMPSHAQAHEFLMHIQSRNVRRKIQSTQQRHRDNLQKRTKNCHQQPQQQSDNNTKPPEMIDMGSSWLACLLLLCRNDPTITPTERLFAAQTLLHRLRRNKLEDSVDVELEQPDIDESRALLLFLDPSSTTPVLHAYLQLMESWNQFVGRVLALANLGRHDLTEVQWKGQATLLTLASILYMNVSSSISNEAMHSMPLLQTLASSIATVALRVCSDSQDDHFSFVPALSETFDLIRRAEEVATNEIASPLVYNASLQVTLATLPESLLGSPDGQQRRGRLSLNPRAVQDSYANLRQKGLNQLKDLIKLQQSAKAGTSPVSLWWTLRTFECWSRFLPLPEDMWELSLPIVQDFLKSERTEYIKSALAYLLAIWEGAACTEEEVLAISLGLTPEKMVQQEGKKKQSSRSKKRHKELLNERSDDTSFVQARNDVALRGRIACLAAANTWDTLMPHFHAALAAANDHRHFNGEGPIGCLAAAAQACLPHLIRHCSVGTHAEAKLFSALAEALQQICGSNNHLVRVLALEPNYRLHEIVLKIIRTSGKVDAALESLLVEHFHKCCMSLASSCGYPNAYFDHFAAPSDEDLEIYRNDVRDMLRSINGSEDGGSTANVESSQPPLRISQMILHRVLLALAHSITESTKTHHLPEETVVHAFSALAKPLNHQAQSWDHIGGQNLQIAMDCILHLSESALYAFDHKADKRIILPVARTTNIAVASLSPMLSKIGMTVREPNRDETNQIRKVLQSAIRLALVSIESFSELPDTLEANDFDTRGAMRGPGGEDHVACVALMRLCSASAKLGGMVTEQFAPFLPRMCENYKRLKALEISRGGHFLNIRGTTPKSRRILLSVVCQIEAASPVGASSVLQDIFHSAIESIASQSGTPINANVLLSLCEASYDLSAFPSNIVASLFDSAGEREALCHRLLLDACCQGYLQPNVLQSSQDCLTQWNRLRAALFTLIKSAGSPDIPGKLVDLVSNLVSSECEGIRRHCTNGSASRSTIFVEDIVGEDGVPAGIFVRSINTLLAGCLQPNCFKTLIQCTDTVLSSIVHTCPDPTAFSDPRCTLAEAWFLCMRDVSSIIVKHNVSDPAIDNMLIDSVCAAIQLMLYPSLGKTIEERRQDPGMSLDGPHTLALCDFLTNFFQLGSSRLQGLSNKAMHAIPCEVSNDVHPGMVVVAAALFRAVQGSFPPWAVESVPHIYSAFYYAMGKDSTLFVKVLAAAMQVRLRGVPCYGGVSEGQLLSGRYFEGVSDQFSQSFLFQVAEICRTDTAGAWKKMKQVVKSACGGKKKETDYKQKPAPTRWEFDRV